MTKDILFTILKSSAHEIYNIFLTSERSDVYFSHFTKNHIK